jgi:hypothetical protein
MLYGIGIICQVTLALSTCELIDASLAIYNTDY